MNIRKAQSWEGWFIDGGGAYASKQPLLGRKFGQRQHRKMNPDERRSYKTQGPGPVFWQKALATGYARVPWAFLLPEALVEPTSDLGC